ncbi:MAG: Isoleucine--tRNA ligase [Parcubacteria bacterium OLB19]|nr:MAG: Isoleucine--tRNA ligase [Parcubacteria bacterium OLB19]
MTNGYKAYELDKATRPLTDFIDDLSVWYLRRSRERLKGEDETDKKLALGTLRYVLKTLAQVMAPAMPFYAEYLWQKVRNGNEAISVHLSEWPNVGEVDPVVIGEMSLVREFVTTALEARTKANIKVRQPLSSLTLNIEMAKEYTDIVAEEINVKMVAFDINQTERVILNTVITPELKMEGDTRDLIRAIQDMRKEAGLVPQDSIRLEIKTNEVGEELLSNTNMSNLIKKTVGASEIIITENSGKEIKAGENSFVISIHKL